MKKAPDLVELQGELQKLKLAIKALDAKVEDAWDWHRFQSGDAKEAASALMGSWTNLSEIDFCIDFINELIEIEVE